MRFSFPLFPAQFEIPDEWWAEAGMQDFKVSGPAFHSTAGTEMVPLRQVEPPFRFSEYPKDWRGFERGRLISIFQGIAAGADMPPVPVVELPPSDISPHPFRLRVCNGLHRFYASVAAGFTHLPVVIQ